MTVNPAVPPSESAGIMTPAEREARWALSVRFAIEAASEAEARAILGQALARLDRELPLQGEPTITPLRLRDGIWVATLTPDLTALASVEPDNATNRCRYVSRRLRGPDRQNVVDVSSAGDADVGEQGHHLQA